MKKKISFLLAAVILPTFTFSLSGCAQLNKDLAELNNKLASIDSQSGGNVMAVEQEANKNQTKVVIPNDKKVSIAIDEALPTIKKVLSIHQCLKENEGMRLLNIHAVTGVDMRLMGLYSIPIGNMQYHDKNKCVSVQALDQWEMPALNALNFRVVFFSYESGEISNFKYFFKKTEGTWKIARSANI